ncbi:hypothetical protein [Microbacterium sp. 69-7]|uniref:protein kinase domain-containing protein n=1 Tax=Microbacterium sp. 69-7 TaxID=1895784 RepID=UPI00258F4297|nr:hypothetical protein [Microbacterium sp. 69-7]
MPGQTLHDRLAQNALTGDEVVSLIIGLAGAPAVVHHAGIVHRDIKPANVLLRPIRHGVVPFRPALVDFGVAHLLDAARVTSPGVVIGTASYPAPDDPRPTHSTPRGSRRARPRMEVDTHRDDLPRPVVAAHGGGVPACACAPAKRAPRPPRRGGRRWRLPLMRDCLATRGRTVRMPRDGCALR